MKKRTVYFNARARARIAIMATRRPWTFRTQGYGNEPPLDDEPPLDPHARRAAVIPNQDRPTPPAKAMVTFHSAPPCHRDSVEPST